MSNPKLPTHKINPTSIGTKKLMRLLMMLSGSILLIFGLLSMLTPIPGGTLTIAIGSGLILCASPTAVRYGKKWRADFSKFNNVVTWVEDKLGERLTKALRQTRPDENADSATVESTSTEESIR